MDPASSYLGKLLLEDVTPVIMVLSTPLVEEACQKNGLSFIEMLRPFCDFDNIDVPVRTSSDQPYRLQTFKLRVFYASDIHPQNHEVAANRLKEVVASASGSILTELESDPPQLDKITSLSESDIQPSWLQKINRDLAGAVSFSDHEAFDHPVACLLAVSSKDENPMNKFVDFFNTNQIPSVLNDSMDPKILKYYLLLHDRQDGPTEKANGILSEIRCTFGMSDCRLLCINSGMDENTEWREYPWFKYKTDCSPMDNITFFLGIDDLNEIKAFMQDLSSKKLIPHMEQKIRILNQQVSATRRGFRNQIKNLWWRKGKEDAPDAPTGSTYTFSSIESQIRVLGDYAFMLRDYELALSNYRLLSTDYKLDKAWKRYAGVQEMMGLALFMLDQSRKDSEYCMETAFQTYVRLGPSALRNATRCGVWWAEMLKARGQYKEAADVYFRISIEDPSLHAAVMLEQSSYCYLFANPPMFRKFGFHLVLAGNRYYISDQREHALRTYRFALSVYRGNAWSYINDHVNYNIGRWYAFLGMFDSATKHMLEVLECSHQSVATQDLFLKEFQHIVQKMGRKLTVPKLQLPFVNMSSIKVIFEDHRTYASPAAANVRENIWQILEENMVPSTTTKTNWLQPRKSSSKKSGDDYISILGEAIRVYVTMKNPLRISIPVSGVSLFCEYSARPVKAESEDTGTLNGGSNYTYGEPLSSRKEDDMEYFELSQIDFVLGGGETRKVQLEVIPKVEGFLKIVGVRWVLSGFVHSYRYFETDVKSNNRKGRKYMISTRTNMSFVVIKGLPKLEGSIADLPRKTFSGDLRPLTLKLENRSEYSIKNLKMMISHPRFLIPGTAGNLCSEFPNCLHKNVHLEGSDDQSDLGKKIDGLPFLFPSDVTIQGGKVLEWPFWLHSAISGNISLYISIYYEIEGSFEMNHRTLRMYYELEVSPSLDISIVVTPCADSLQEFIVRFEIASKMIAESLWLRQLSSIGSRWTLSALPSFDYDGNKLLVAGQALSCFFKLKESSTKDGTVSDMLLGSPEESEPLLDISTRPITDFHYHEKVHQGIALQDHTMDFVLISQLIRDGTNSENSERDQVQLLSHHVCGSSILSRNPVWSLMSGPQEIRHDFSAPFCITSFDLTVYNYSEHAAFVKVSTFEVSDVPSESTADLLKCKSGWHDISLDTDTGSSGINHSTASSNVTSPFLWCGSSSRTLQLQPMSLAKVPLTVCVFSPGIYNLSAYEVRWNLHISNSEGSRDMKWQSSGVNKGRPHYFTVLQSLQK